MLRCDICNRRPAIANVQMRHAHGMDYGRPSRKVRMCRPCGLAVLAKYPDEYIWPPRGVFLEPHEVPA